MTAETKLKAKTMKIQCEDCLKFFKKKELEELAVTQEKLCKACYEIRKALQHPDDPYSLP